MINLGKARWLVPALLPCGVLAGLFQFNLVSLNFEAESLLAYKGKLKHVPQVEGARVERVGSNTVRVIGQGTTPSRAVHSAESAAASLSKTSLNQKKTEIRRKITAVKNRQAVPAAKLKGLDQERQYASKGSRQSFTPQMASRLNEARGRHRILVQNYPTHTDIAVLAREIKTLEAAQRGQVKIDPSRVSKLGRQVNEARMELSLLTGKVRRLETALASLASDWTVNQPAALPRRPVSAPGWPVAAGSALAAFALGFFLMKGSQRGRDDAASNMRPFMPARPDAQGSPLAAKIPLALATEEPGPLPDDPLTRKAAALYERWLDLVKVIYATGPEAPKDIYVGADPLFKETVGFLAEGQDTLTRHLARVVVPGDLFSHVARTVLIALMGAHEAGASTAQQQGMTYAALFHDLAVAPRPSHAWHEIGSEVGRLSSAVLRKIPGIPAPLLAMVEEILVGMDEYPMDTWQNVPRSPGVASFSKLLGHIDRFDKVMQKQKTRLNRRIAAA